MRSESPERGKIDVPGLLQDAGQAYATGDFARAEELYKQSLNFLDAHSLGDSPESALCLQSLAEIYQRAGQPQWVIPLYRRLLTLGENILGPHHGEVITTVYRLASTYDDLRMREEAEQMYRRAIGSAEKTFGLGHPNTQKIRESFSAFMTRREDRQPIVPPAGEAGNGRTAPAIDSTPPQPPVTEPMVGSDLSSSNLNDFMPPQPKPVIRAVDGTLPNEAPAVEPLYSRPGANGRGDVNSGPPGGMDFMPPPPPRTQPGQSSADHDFLPPPPPIIRRANPDEATPANQDVRFDSGELRSIGALNNSNSASGIDFALLAVNTGVSRAVKRPSIAKRPTKLKNVRYRADSADEEQEKSLVVKNIFRRWHLIAYVTIALVGIGVFFFVLFSHLSQFTAANYEDAVHSVLIANKHFESVDGVSGLEFESDAPYITLMNDVKHRKIPFVILKGSLGDFGVMLSSAFIHREVWYQNKNNSLIGDNGVVLYAKSAPVLNVIAAMQAYENFLQDFYRDNRTYPSNQKKLRDSQTIRYTNPFTGKSALPNIMNLDIVSLDKEYLFPGITSTKSDTAILDFLKTGGSWKEAAPPEPGGIYSVALRQGKERVGDYYYCSEVYLKAYDADGRPVTGGLPGTQYVVGLKQGKRLSDFEADRKKDVETSSVHPPDRICVLEGDADNTNLMRQCVPIILVLAFLGCVAGWVAFEFKLRKESPQRAPQIFEVLAAVTLFLLIVIWIIHTLP
jgi:hypothetical protein